MHITDASAREWTVLQTQYEQYEFVALAIKLVAVSLFAVSLLLGLQQELVGLLMLVLWMQDPLAERPQRRGRAAGRIPAQRGAADGSVSVCGIAGGGTVPGSGLTGPIMEHPMGRKRIGTCLAALLLLLAAPVHALQISGLTPQGEVARVRQVVVKFDQAAVRLGDAQAPAPVAISCDDPQAAKGSGRWATERSWTFDFAQDLPPGVRCAVQANADLRSPTGAALAGQIRFSFSSGGPFVQNTVPYAGSRIDEEQHFILRLNGPATPESIQAHVWCGMRGLGERIAVRLVEGADRAAMLRARRLERQASAAPL